MLPLIRAVSSQEVDKWALLAIKVALAALLLNPSAEALATDGAEPELREECLGTGGSRGKGRPEPETRAPKALSPSELLGTAGGGNTA